MAQDNGSDQLIAAMRGVSGDPNDPATIQKKLGILFSKWGRPQQIQPSSAPDVIDETPGAGDDGAGTGYKQSRPVPGSSEQSSGSSPDPAEPKPANPASLGHVQRAQDAVPRAQAPGTSDAHLVPLAKQLAASGMFGAKDVTEPGASAEPGFAGAELESHVGLPIPARAEDAAEPSSTEDLENHAASSTPGMFADAARASEQKPHGVLGILGAIGKQALGRLGNAGYAISGGDPREMHLKEQSEQFEEEMAREKADPEYQRRVAEATTPGELEVTRGPNGDYEYTNVNKFSGRATPTGLGAPTPEKSPAQVLNEFVQNNPDALIKGTDANTRFEELAESLRAFPSNQAQIRADAQMFVGRLGVQRASIMADAIIRSMQGRNISAGMQAQADAVKAEIEAATRGWAEYFTAHPYLQAMGYGPDAESQARFMADRMAQLSDLADQANQQTQKIQGATPNVVPSIIGNAANAHSKRGTPLTEAEAADYLRRAGGDRNKARQLARQDGRTF